MAKNKLLFLLIFAGISSTHLWTADDQKKAPFKLPELPRLPAPGSATKTAVSNTLSQFKVTKHASPNGEIYYVVINSLTGNKTFWPVPKPETPNNKNNDKN